MRKLYSIMSNSQTVYHLKLNLKKADQHRRGKWLIHGTKHYKDNQLQAWNSPVEYLSKESKHDIKEPKVICSIQYSKTRSSGKNIQGGM